MLRRIQFFLLVAGTAFTSRAGAQQALERFSYDGIRFTGVQAEVGVVTSDRLKGAVSYGLRVDLGQFAPRVRLQVGGAWYRSEFQTEEIAKFEETLRGVVNDPTGDFDINLGTIHWSDFALDADLQYLLATAGRWRPYVGIGAGVHLRNGSGRAIDGTFVEDALDEVGAGLSVTGGFDVFLTRAIALNIGGRAVVAGDLQTLGLMIGFGFKNPGANP